MTAEGSLRDNSSSRSTACVISQKGKKKGETRYFLSYVHQAAKVYDIFIFTYMGRAFARGPHIKWIEMKERMYVCM